VPATNHRNRYTVNLKCLVLCDLVELEKQQVPLPLTALHTLHPNIPYANLSKWSTNRQSLFEAKQNGLGHARSIVTVNRVQFQEIEELLYMHFVWRRSILGLQTDDKWVAETYRKLLEQEQPPGWSICKISPGLISGFKNRYRITSQCQTNKNMIPIRDREDRIKQFHRDLFALQLCPPLRCPKYGRHPACCRFHMDQIPLPFVLRSKKTLNEKGQPVFILQPHGSGLDKRQASIILCICAATGQLVKIAIILKGEGRQLSPEEKAAYAQLAPFIEVYFQPNAWADESVMLLWLEQFIRDTASMGNVEKLLGMDCHGAQQTATFKTRARQANVLPFYTPPKCTDCISPVDHHVGSNLKHKISTYYKQDLIKNRAIWCDANSPVAAWKRRVKMVTWTAAAWIELQDNSYLLRQAFVSTGWLLALDGSENSKITIPGLPGYDFTT
jgi:hypothetical protein